MNLEFPDRIEPWIRSQQLQSFIAGDGWPATRQSCGAQEMGNFSEPDLRKAFQDAKPNPANLRGSKVQEMRSGIAVFMLAVYATIFFSNLAISFSKRSRRDSVCASF